MSDISQKVSYNYVCSGGHSARSLVWSIIDLAEREVSDPVTLASVRCRSCGELVPIDLPLVLLSSDDRVGIVICDSPSFDLSDVEAWQSLGMSLPVPPATIVRTSRTLAPLIAKADASGRIEPALRAMAPNHPQLGNPLAALLASIDRLTQHRHFHLLLDEVSNVISSEQLSGLLELRPELASEAFLAFLDESNAAIEEWDDIAEHILPTLRQLFADLVAGVDVDTAWTTFTEAQNTFYNQQIQPELRSLLAELDNQQTQGHRRSALFARALTLARAANETTTLARLLIDRAGKRLAPFNLVPPEVAADILPDLNEAYALAEGLDIETRAVAANSIAFVTFRSNGGDKTDRIERAIAFQEEAINWFDQTPNVDDRALARTNLSIMYLDREIGDLSSNYSHAESLCREALRLRPRAGNPLGWAYTQTNLARCLTYHAAIAANANSVDRMFTEAIDAYLEAEETFATIDQPGEALAAKQNRASALFELARTRHLNRRRAFAREALTTSRYYRRLLGLREPYFGGAEDMLINVAETALQNPLILRDETARERLAAITLAPNYAENQLVTEARSEALTLLTAREGERNPDYALTCKLLAHISDWSNESASIRAEYLAAAIPPFEEYGMLDDLLDVAADLGTLYAERGDWPSAEVVYRVAIDAMDTLYSLRGTSQGQRLELSKYPKLHEDACYVLTKCGKYAQAVEVLEGGRARGLGLAAAHSEIDLDAVRELDEELGNQLTLVSERLRSVDSPIYGGGGSGKPIDLSADLRTFRNLVGVVRRLPGMERFLAGPSVDDLRRLSRSSRPLAYVVSTISGTICLLVEPDQTYDGALRVTLVADTAISYKQLVSFMANFGSDGPPTGLDYTEERERVEENLSALGRLLGDAFVSELAGHLQDTDVQAVALVPTGIVGLMPLSAAILDPAVVDTSGGSYLCDLLAVSLAPSAYVLATCERRAARLADAEIDMLTLGDPGQSRGSGLKWAAVEANSIRVLVGEGKVSVRIGDHATKQFLTSNAGAYNYLHLACHGCTNRADPTSSSLAMADGVITVAELETFNLDCRFAALSACESGVFGPGVDGSEYVSLPGALIAAGVAGVVASLWSVDDLGTCLLMLRYYEELVDMRGSNTFDVGGPARALQAAQKWLRSADYTEFGRFVSRYPDLRTNNRVADMLQRHNRGLHEVSEADVDFGSAWYWAAFMAVGA